MIKIMIIDDEILARVGIKSLINWQEYGLEVVGEAANGSEALEMAEDLKPDIIITDIKMPIMDGITMIKSFKDKDINPRFIVVSAYDEFKYVREAMKLGAEDYILKMEIDKENLLQIISKMKLKIEDNRKSNNNKNPNANTENGKEELIRDLLFGAYEDEKLIQTKVITNDLNICNKNVFCLVIKIDNNIIEDYNHQQLYELDQNLKDLLKGILLNYKNSYFTSLRDFEYTVIYSTDDRISSDGEINKVKKTAIKIRDLLKKYTNLLITVGISMNYDHYRHLPAAYKEALEAVKHSFNYPRGSIIEYSEIKDDINKNKYRIFQEELDDLQESLEVMDSEEIDSILTKIARGMEDKKLSRFYLEGVCSTIIYVINNFVEDNYLDPVNVWGQDINPYRDIKHLYSQYDFIKWVGEITKKLKQQLEEYKKSNRVINKVQFFINKHYYEDISLKKMADYVNISPNYLSNLFKKETEKTFVEYLTECRIKEAKTLLKNTEYKVYEIAELVGYKNVYYFSKVFKEYTGYSPNQYRLNDF